MFKPPKASSSRLTVGHAVLYAMLAIIHWTGLEEARIFDRLPVSAVTYMLIAVICVVEARVHRKEKSHESHR